MHLAIDSREGDPALLGDAGIARDFLLALPARIGMTIVAPPQVHEYRGGKPSDWGISGFALIAESHITVHTFPERRYANIDVFSCKPFDVESTIAAARAAFGLRSVQCSVLERGLEYLDDGERAARHPSTSTSPSPCD